jgi:hypothetical protein
MRRQPRLYDQNVGNTRSRLFAAHVWAAFLLYQTVDNRRLHQQPTARLLVKWGCFNNYDYYCEFVGSARNDNRFTISFPVGRWRVFREG